MKWLSTIFGISVVLVVRTSASKAIFTDTDSRTWISKENLTTLIRLSFDRSTCCNTLLAGETVAIADVFNKFVRIYPHGQTLNNRTYDCPNYFLITASVNDLVTVMKKVPTTIATVRLLIVFTSNNVEASSGAFNVSMYQNANVNIATHNGLWTLSENFLNPRVFTRVSRYSKTSYEQKFANFRGRELKVATVHFPPYSYLGSTVQQTEKEVTTKLYTQDDQAELDGIELQLFMLTARILNFTWTMRQGDRINRYGKKNGSAWSGGLVGQVYHKEVDIAFSAMYVTADRYEVTNMTRGWVQCFGKFVVPKPKPHRSFFALITPLSKEVWVAIITTLIIQTLYVFVRAWIDPRISRRFRNFVVTLIELMGQLLGVWMPAKMRGLRVQLHFWHLGGILLVTAYTSNLASRLAREAYENRIDTLQQLADSNLTWGSRDIPNFENMFNDEDPHGRKIKERFVFEASSAETHANILRGNYAISGLVINTVFISRHDIIDEDFQGFRVMDEAISTQYVGFSVQPWLAGPLDMVIVHLQESGLVNYHFDSEVSQHIGSTQRDLTVEKDDNEGPKVLALTSLGVAFCILILGLSISTIVFFLELKYFNKELSPRELLSQIQKNREVWRIKELRRKRKYPFFGSFQEQQCHFVD